MNPQPECLLCRAPLVMGAQCSPDYCDPCFTLLVGRIEVTVREDEHAQDLERQEL